jgi:hypothetical protein
VLVGAWVVVVGFAAVLVGGLVTGVLEVALGDVTVPRFGVATDELTGNVPRVRLVERV